MDNFKITGTHEMGNGARAQADMTIKNPSNVSILVEEMPVELHYDNTKVTEYSGHLSFNITTDTQPERVVHFDGQLHRIASKAYCKMVMIFPSVFQA